MPEFIWTPPLSSAVWTKWSMWAGCGSLPSKSLSKAVPGAFIDRRASPCLVRSPSPISQSASLAVCFITYCLTREPKTSEPTRSEPLLTKIPQVDFGPGDAVCQFVADHIQRNREAVEDGRVAVTEHHRMAIPEGIVEPIAEMDGSGEV